MRAALRDRVRARLLNKIWPRRYTFLQSITTVYEQGAAPSHSRTYKYGRRCTMPLCPLSTEDPRFRNSFCVQRNPRRHEGLLSDLHGASDGRGRASAPRGAGLIFMLPRYVAALGSHFSICAELARLRRASSPMVSL